MKLSKTIQWILIIGILVALLAGVAVIYMRQRASHDDLNKDLTQAQQDLVTNSQQKEELESQLSQDELVLAALESQFPHSQAAEIEQGLLDAAGEAGVTITSLHCSAPGTEQQGAITYQYFLIDLTVEGKRETLLYFSNALGYWFPSASIQRGNMPVVAEGEETSLILALKIYTR